MTRWVVLFLGGWVVLGCVREIAVSSEQVSLQREITFVYSAKITHIPQEAREVQIWIPLAKTGSDQQIFLREVQSPIPYTIARDPEYGNDILHLTLESPFPEQLEVEVGYHALLRRGEAQGAESSISPAERERYSQARGLVIIDDEIRARTERATAGRSTLIEQARGIYDNVIRHMAYDKSVPGWGRGDTRRACLLGKGNCTDFHSLFISMARAERILARFKIGVIVPSKSSGTIQGYHCWAEFYVEGEGWVPVDASEAWKHPELADDYFGVRDANRFLMSMGRDIQLIPKQQGDPVNIFFYPYVEVNGEVFQGVETEFRFKDLQKEGVL